MDTSSLDAIPAILRECPSWVHWRFADRVDAQTGEVKRTKVPFNPATDQHAKSTDPATWAPFPAAVAAVERYAADGVGFVLTAADPFVGVDLDHCYDPTNGAIEYTARRIVSDLYSYTEITPSGTGLRVFCRGALPPGGRKKGGFEMYAHARFLTVTGRHLAFTPHTVEARTEELAWVHARIWPPPPLPARRSGSGPAPALSDSAILDAARRAANSAKFAALWAGDTSGYGGDESSADLALCSLLAFWTTDQAQIDRLFRQSRLYRDKWDSARPGGSYGTRTVDLALSGERAHYQGGVRV